MTLAAAASARAASSSNVQHLLRHFLRRAKRRAGAPASTVVQPFDDAWPYSVGVIPPPSCEVGDSPDVSARALAAHRPTNRSPRSRAMSAVDIKLVARSAVGKAFAVAPISINGIEEGPSNFMPSNVLNEPLNTITAAMTVRPRSNGCEKSSATKAKSRAPSTRWKRPTKRLVKLATSIGVIPRASACAVSSPRHKATVEPDCSARSGKEPRTAYTTAGKTAVPTATDGGTPAMAALPKARGQKTNPTPSPVATSAAAADAPAAR
mmetsp:Transcript_69035/g.225081  ORF Transcript_69035/g.225081 Transcript_69035/m.225081 type:complete len:265 (+) Transcript_69035:1337-2131(+)